MNNKIYTEQLGDSYTNYIINEFFSILDESSRFIQVKSLEEKDYWEINIDKINEDTLETVSDVLSQTDEGKNLLGLIDFLTNNNINNNDLNPKYVDILRINSLQKVPGYIFFSAIYAELDNNNNKQNGLTIRIPDTLFKNIDDVLYKTVKIKGKYNDEYHLFEVEELTILGSCRYYRQIISWQIELKDDYKITFNSHNENLPKSIKTIGLIAPPRSQAREDFIKILSKFHFPTCIKEHDSNDLKTAFILGAIEELEKDCEVICIVRGGGPLCDLSYLSEPKLINKIYKCQAYIVTGIGHANNTTLADKVADYAAISPTDAAYYVAKLIKDINIDDRLNKIEAKIQKIDELLNHDNSITKLNELTDKLSIISQQIKNIESYTVSDLIKKLSN
ncbi:exodeoxyribonuclease VII large subunit [Selenomonas ruminantium]|uniref:Exonuclease VII, large subunit n=1 Tax=Selenomonas ruminantium TaxID=971 RepID=A0A1I0W823_SELRU|nr:exodeoxyribonuclease VII large subunit [Selenomonas ruminantium]SFA84467.1 Exonuclease VII, large subunit [Selenomonas ruminantium]